MCLQVIYFIFVFCVNLVLSLLLCIISLTIYSWWEVPWCIGGDFNVFRLPSGCSNDRRMSPAMWEFLDFISELSLLDLSLLEGNFT